MFAPAVGKGLLGGCWLFSPIGWKRGNRKGCCMGVGGPRWRATYPPPPLKLQKFGVNLVLFREVAVDDFGLLNIFQATVNLAEV